MCKSYEVYIPLWYSDVFTDVLSFLYNYLVHIPLWYH